MPTPTTSELWPVSSTRKSASLTNWMLKVQLLHRPSNLPGRGSPRAARVPRGAVEREAANQHAPARRCGGVVPKAERLFRKETAGSSSLPTALKNSRACSSDGESVCLLNRSAQVRVLPGPPDNLRCGVAQAVERWPHKPTVAGSTPASAIRQTVTSDK